MADFWSNYAALGIPLAPERDESVARLERMIGQKRLSSGVMAGEAPGMGYRVAQSIPFLGSAGTALHGHEIEQAQKRISEGKGTDRDFSIVSDAFVDAEAQQNQSFGQDVLQGGMATTGYMAELAATGGLASGAIGARAGAGLASRVGVGAADLAVGTAASGQWLPHAQRYGADSYGTRLNEETDRQEYQRVAEGDPLMEALGKGYARAALTRVVETLGGEAVATGGRVAGRMAANLPGVGAVAGGAAGVVDAIGSAPWLANVKVGLGKAWEKATGKGAVELREVLEKGAGWSNLIGEIGEERLEEVLAGATGLEDDYGMTGRAAQIVGEKVGLVEPKEGGGESGGDFLRDFLVELAVLGTAGGGMKGVSAGAALLDDPGVNAELGRRFDAAFTGIENRAQRASDAVVDTLFPRTESSIPERTIEGPAGEMPPFPTAESLPVQPAAEQPVPDQVAEKATSEDGQVLTVNTSEPSSIAEKVNAGRPLSRREAASVGGTARTSTEQRQALSDDLRRQASEYATGLLETDPELAGSLWLAAGEGTLTDESFTELTGEPVPYPGYASVLATAMQGGESESATPAKTPSGDDDDPGAAVTPTARERAQARQRERQAVDEISQRSQAPERKPGPVEQSPVGPVDDAAFRELQREEERARKAWTKGMDQFPVGSPELHELASKVFAAREAVDKATVARADAAKGGVVKQSLTTRKPTQSEGVKESLRTEGIPDLGRDEGSWIVTDQKTGEVVGEFFDRKDVEKLHELGRFTIETAGTYLRRVNGEIAAGSQAYNDKPFSKPKPEGPDFRELAREAVANNENVRGLFKRHGLSMRKDRDLSLAVGDEINRLRSEQERESPGRKSAVMADPQDYKTGVEGAVVQAMRAMAHAGTRGDYSLAEIAQQVPGYRQSDIGKAVGNLIKAGELEGVKGPGLRVGRSQLSAVRAPKIDAEYEARKSGSAARKPVAKTASADRVEDLLAAIRRIEPGANRGALVTFRDLRKEFPDLSKEQFDRMVLKASADGVMAIHRHDYPSSLTQPERDAMVTNGTDYFIGGSLRRDSGPAVMGEPLADPEMERARQVVQMESDGVPVGTSSVLESQRKAQVVAMEGKNPRRAGGQPMTKAEREKQERVRREREKKAYGTRGERHEPKRTNAPSGHVVPYSRVVERLIKAFDRLGVSLEVHTGRMQPTTRTMAAGHFMPQSGVARISRSGNIVTIFHEAGHALEAKVLIGRGKFVGVGGQRAMNMIRNTPLKGLTPEVESDLVGLAQLLYKKEPLNGWRSEGIAELFQKWVLDTKRLEAFPHAKEWMETHVLGLDKKFASDMRKAQDLGHKWWRMSNVEAVESQVKRAEWRDVVDRVRRYFRENPIIDTMFESYMPLRQMEIEAAKIRGVEKPTEKQTPIYNRAKALRRADNAIARRMLYENMVTPTGQVVGPSLRGLLRDAELTYADREKVGLYLYVRRGLALWNDPNGPRDPGVGREVLEGAYAELSQDPRLEVFAQGWDTWNEQLLDYMAALSPRMAMNVARMRQLDPGAYAPLEAWFESWEDTPLGSSANQVNVASGDVSKRLRGSGRRRRDPLESIVSIVADRVGAAHDRNIMEMTIELAARTPDLGKWVHQVPVEQMTVAERSVHDVLAKVVKKASGNGMDRGASGWQLTNDSGEVIDLDAALDQLVAFHAPAVSPVGPDARYLQPFIDGRGNLTWWRFEPRLLNAISKGGQRSTRTGVALFDALVDFWAYSNLVIKMFQVGLNQSFLLITQPLRDIKTAPSRTRSDSWMPRVMGEFLWDYVQGGASAIVGDRYESKLLELYKNLGLEVTAPLKRDWAATIRTSRGLFRVWDPKKNTGANFLELLKKPGQAVREGGSRVMEYTMNLGQWTDRVPRIGEMRRVLQQNGWDIDNLTMEQRVLLAMAAKEVTQDNTAGGHFTGIFNKLLMYHRAWAQGVRGSVAAVHRNPMRALGNQAIFLALNVGLWLENRDDEEWRNLPPYRKWSNYFFGFDYGGRKEYLVIPAEQDMETAFVMGTTAMLDAWYHQDPQSAVEWARHFAMLNMPVMPGLLSEIWEQRGNHDSFTDQAIVPEGMRWMAPEDQYDEYTTMVAYWLGQELGWSPKRIDHALHGVFARTGKGLMTGAFGTVGRDPWWKTWLTGEDQSTREGELADTFIFGKLFQAGGAIGSRPESVGKIFDLAREAEARAAGARAGQSKPMTDVERQRHYLLRAAGSRMKGYFDAKKAAYKSVDRDAISREMVRDAEQVLERLKTLEGE